MGEGRKLKNLEPLAKLVNTFEPEVEDLTDDELRAKTAEFRRAGGERRVAGRPAPRGLRRRCARPLAASIGQRHFDVQLMGGAALHQGNIAEMKTGEGKTLVSTLPGYLNAMSDKGVHVVTVNDYLAKRDSEWMGGIYRFLGLDVGLIQATMTPQQRRPAYGADITYGTNNEFGFDYLRDNMAMRLEECVQRGYNFAIVDEVDSILIDEARTPLIISGMVADSAKWYVTFARIAPRLKRDEDYEVEESKYQVAITEARRGQGRGDPGHREPLRAREHHARAPPAELAARQGAVQARRRLRGDRRRGQDRRRVHRPRARGPALLRGPAPGDRGQGGRQDQGREPDARHDHDPELLQDVRQALGHDGYRQDPAHRVRGDLQDLRRRDPHEPPERPQRRAGPDLQERDGEVERRRRRHHRAERGRSARPGGHRVDREVRGAVHGVEPARRPAQRAERQEPREGSRHRRPGRAQGRGHRGDEHGGPRRRHPAGRQPRVPRPPGDGGARIRQRRLPVVRDGRGRARGLRGRVRADLREAALADRCRTRRSGRAGRALRAGHRTARVPADRQPAAWSCRPPGRPRRIPVLPLARGRPHADVRLATRSRRSWSG